MASTTARTRAPPPFVRCTREETGLTVDVGRLLHVHSLHLEGVSPDGVLEDYHAIRLVFVGRVPPDAPEPQVLERDGTTADARPGCR